jgi:hypothetical protein
MPFAQNHKPRLATTEYCLIQAWAIHKIKPDGDGNMPDESYTPPEWCNPTDGQGMSCGGGQVCAACTCPSLNTHHVQPQLLDARHAALVCGHSLPGNSAHGWYVDPTPATTYIW